MDRLTTRNSVGVAVYKHPYECERCGEHYEVEYDKYEYCPNCGQKVSWEDWESEEDEEENT